MFKKILLLLVVLIVIFLIVRNVEFGNKKQENPVDSVTFTPSIQDFEQQKITADSFITWSGENKIQGKSHTGTLLFNRESSFIGLTPKNETGEMEIIGGALSVDMTTLAGAQGEPEMLVNHLRSADFFDVETYKEANFVVTEHGEGFVKGLMTLKGKTHEVVASYAITPLEGQYRIEGEFEIDRTLWDITTLSGTFFQDIGDSVVEDMIGLKFVLITEPSN